MNATTETFGRYQIEISGPDKHTNNWFWVRVKSTKSKMGRTVNNSVSLCKTIEEANAKVEAFKASKKHQIA